MKKLYNSLLTILLLVFFSVGARGQWADFSFELTYDCEPVSVFFYNLSDTNGITGNAHYTWHVDGIPYDTWELQEIEFFRGYHHVEFQLWDDGSFSDSHAEEFEIYGTVQDFGISSGPEACPGEPVNFWIQEDFYNAEWDFGDASFITDANYDGFPTHTYYDTGQYNITMIASNDCGTDTIVKPITVTSDAVPLVEAFSTQGMYCINDEVIFNTRAEYTSYLWDFGDGNTSTEKNPSHFYDTQVEKSYTVTLTGTNACGQSDTDTIEVYFITDKPAEADFNYWFDGYWGNPCPNQPVHFSTWVSGTYEWDFGDGSKSTEREPTNIYSVPGDYIVTLTVTNGCRDTAQHSELISVIFTTEDIPYTEFMFNMPYIDYDEQEYMDTLEICPGELVYFENMSYSTTGTSVNYEWDFSDENTSAIKNASHVFTDPGVYPVTLTASTVCGGSDYMTKYVNVRNDIYPDASLGVVPRVICDGEQVFFFDEKGDFDEKSYVYSIDFGDGEVMENITKLTDTVLQTLANHTYTGDAGSKFIFNFTVTNKCGNSQSVSDTIWITDDTANKPFYYVQNSTQSGDEIPMEDWSVRKDPTDHEMKIRVSWPLWYAGLNDMFYIYFWYGGFDPDGEDPGPPNGYVQFTSPDISMGDTVTAYIPLSAVDPPYIGMAAGWSCSGTVEIGIEPDAYGVPTCEGSPVTSINLVPGDSTMLTDIACDGIIIDPEWDGLCNEDLPFQQSYYQIDPNSYVHLKMWRDEMSYEFYGSSDPEGYNWQTEFSSGTWDYYDTGEGIEIYFYGETGCIDPGYYWLEKYKKDTMRFVLYEDLCSERAQYLTKKEFIQKPDYGMVEDFSGCPGDDVLFNIAGGISYEWNFGDEYTSNEQFTKHTYSEPGVYDAYVVATNACGRTDTIYTKVTIKDNNLPIADFWIDKYDAPRFEPFYFMVDDWYDPAGNYIYLWHFGDGDSSNVKEPTHAYERDGDYMVTLKVTNGCGTSSTSEHIWVQDAMATCNAKFDFVVSGDTVTFTDMSWGSPASWFWDFGDGTTLNQKNPKHLYSNDGIYFVCLSIFNDSTDCASQTCREVAVGTVGCRADFKFTVNEALSTVQFTDVSTEAQEWFWDFGDGTFSADQNPTHTYSEPGIYMIYLAIYNETIGCFAETEKEIQVGADQADIIFADFSYFVDEANKTVSFTDESSDNVSDWYWTFGDGTYISERHPEHLYPSTGIFEVCLIVFDELTGTSAEVCKKIPVGVSTCNINADFSYFIDINTDAITFNDKSTGNITKWFWNFGDGTTSSQKNPKHAYTKAGYYLVTLSVFNEETDCADHVAEFIQIGTVDCRAFYEYSVDAENNKVSFVNKSKGNIADYFWFFGDGDYSVEKDPVHQFDNPGLYFVELTVVDASGLCMDYYFEPIQVGNLDCRANFSYFIDSLSNVAYFTPDVVGNITDYLWFFGDGAISTKTSPVHTFTQPGYFTVGLNTFDAATGCMDYYEEIILIGREGIDCRADFMYMTDPTTLEVSFTDKSKGNIMDWVWNYGDGVIETDQNPKHTYTEGGYYFVCLTVVNNWGITNTVCDYIQVAPAAGKDCRANFIFTADSTSKTVRFTDKSFGKPDEWFWNFDDGTISSEQNPVYSFSESGVYLVYLSIANHTTNCASENAKLINVGMGYMGLESDFTYDIDTVSTKADSYPVDFIGVSLGDGNKLKWDFGDGSFDTTSLQPTHTYNAPGKYVVCLTISNPVTKDSDTKCDTLYVGITGTGDPFTQLNPILNNYPNPFRDITNVVYQLTTPTDVDLSIFDNSGRKIETLVSKHQDAGKYIIEYNGSYLDSGIYHLRLVTRNQVITNMMIVR